MKSKEKNIFPHKPIENFYYSFRHKLSEWFPGGRILNDGEFIFTQPADSQKPHSISFCENLSSCKLINLNATVTCVITNHELANKFERQLGIVVVADPRKEFLHLHNFLAGMIFEKSCFTPSAQKSTQIHQTAFVDKNCYLGNNVIVGPGAIILKNSYIEDGVIIGPNVVIGSEGLEFHKLANGLPYKVNHMGGVYIGSGVEIMANSVVSKDVYFGFTFIGNDTKIGPLCNIAHRARIGEKCLIAGNSTIAGSAKIGNSVWIGPSATISNGIHIGEHSKISIGSVVVNDVEAHQQISGFFGMHHRKALKIYSFLLSKIK